MYSLVDAVNHLGYIYSERRSVLLVTSMFNSLLRRIDLAECQALLTK